MIAYCETSFFIRQLIAGPDRGKANEVGADLEERFGFIPITNLTRYECIQGLRFDAWLNQNDRSKGSPLVQVEAAINIFLAQLGGAFRLQKIDWEEAFDEAVRLSRETPNRGWRTVDVLHVAAAITSGAQEFYSFDADQNQLAASCGLKTPLALISNS
jgi:hypothetical protein